MSVISIILISVLMSTYGYLEHKNDENKSFIKRLKYLYANNKTKQYTLTITNVNTENDSIDVHHSGFPIPVKK